MPAPFSNGVNSSGNPAHKHWIPGHARNDKQSKGTSDAPRCLNINLPTAQAAILPFEINLYLLQKLVHLSLPKRSFLNLQKEQMVLFL